MKIFKQFFEDKEPSDVSIVAQEPGKEAETLGHTTDIGKEKIANLITRVGQNADQLIDDLVSDSAFSHPHYKKLFKSELTEHKYNVDWDAFAEHVKNRKQVTQLQSGEYFGGTSGTFNLYDKVAPIFGKFIRNKELLPEFFHDVFKINPAIEGTSVGDGEFLLGVIGNGYKGTTGDVDVEGQLVPNGKLEVGGGGGEGGLTLEVGTQDKIIGSSTRKKKGDKTVKNLARFIRNACLTPWGADRDVNINLDPNWQAKLPSGSPGRAAARKSGISDVYLTHAQKWNKTDAKGDPSIRDMLMQYEVLKKNPSDLDFVIGELQKYSGDTEETGAADPSDLPAGMGGTDKRYDIKLKPWLQEPTDPDDPSTGVPNPDWIPKVDPHGYGGVDVRTRQFVGTSTEQPLTRIIGAVVLYDYITEHGDDVIASINFGGKEQSSKKGWRRYDVRWANINKLKFRGTVTLMKQGFFNFGIDGDNTRFTLGSNTMNPNIESLSFKSIFKQILM